MTNETFLTWEEAQRLALPPNATMLIPPVPEPVEVAALVAGPPNTHPTWLDDGFYTAKDTATKPAPLAVDADEARAAAESAEYGPGPVRLLANVIALNALLDYALAPAKKDEVEEKKKKPNQS